jgi:hypothetical protein
MMDEFRAQEKGAKPENAPSDTGTPVPLVKAIQTKPQENTAKDTRNPRPKKLNPILRLVKIIRKHRREFPKWTDIAIVILTGGIVLLAYMQHKDMTDSGAQTDRIIEADKRIATAMEGNLAQSIRSLDASIELSRSDQRAWVGMVGIDVNKAVQDSPFSYAVSIQNTGKTPALNVHILTTSKGVPKGQTPQFTYELPSNAPVAATTIQPSMRVKMGGTPDSLSRPLTTDQFQSLKSGAAVMYIYGKIDYEDVFKGLHHTQFCGFLEADLASVHSCFQYNTAN